jgi:hypothetical protein
MTEREAMSAIIRCTGLVGHVIAVTEDRDPDGLYLASYDVDAHEGRGEIAWTEDRHSAMIFKDAAAAMAIWQQQSTVTPLRPDGKPNRPMTAFSVELETLTEVEMFDMLFEGFVDMKRKAVAMNVFDVPFIIHYATDTWVLSVMTPDRGFYEQACVQLLLEYGPPEWMSINSDSWYRNMDNVPPEYLERGCLETAFMEGDLAIGEQLVAVSMGQDFIPHSAARKYTFDDTGAIVFEDNPPGRELIGTLTHVMHRMLSLTTEEGVAEFTAFLEQNLRNE